MGRTIRLENPEIWAGLVDVDESTPAELVARILAIAETASGDDDQAVHRRGLRHVPRLRPGSAPAVALTRFEGDSSHLVIGATGNVGRISSASSPRWAPPLWLRYPAAAQDNWRIWPRSWRPPETLVEVAADAADETAMSALFSRFGADLPPLEGVYLAALSGSEALLTEMSDADVTSMFRSKLDAAAVLHRLTLRTPLRRFVLFSRSPASRVTLAGPLHGGQHLPRCAGLRPTHPRPGCHRHRVGPVEDLGRRTTVDEIGRSASDAQ